MKKSIKDKLIFAAIIIAFYGVIGIGLTLETFSSWAFVLIVVGTIISFPLIHLISKGTIPRLPVPSSFLAIKLSHMTSGILIVLFIILFGRLSTLTLLAAFMISYPIYLYFRRSNRNILFFSEIFSVLWGKDTFKGKVFLGGLYGLIGVFITLLLFEPRMAIAALVSFIFADPSAAIIGKKFGKHRWFFNSKKTIEGSISYFLVVFIVLTFIIPIKNALIIALIGAMVESLPYLNDNVSVPVCMGAALSLIR